MAYEIKSRAEAKRLLTLFQADRKLKQIFKL